jgi:hypothetical protein
MKRLVAGILFCVLMLTGCEFSPTSIDTMIHPPKLSQEQTQIYSALKSAVNGDIDMVYPKTGDYRSAFVVKNLDGEESEEAVVFYKETSATSSVRFTILDQENDQWYSVCDATSTNATDVEKIAFIQGEHRVYLVIGFNQTGVNEKTLSIYEYANQNLNLIFSESCANFEVYDINDDGQNEIITLVNTLVTETQRQTKARMYTIKSGKCTLKSETLMDDESTAYVNLYKGKLNDGSAALYLDAQKGTDFYGTEILTAQGSNLENITNEKGLNQMTKRAQGLSCTEMEEGVYAIPQLHMLSGYSQTVPSEQPYWIDWYEYDVEKETFRKTDTTYSNYSLGYSFEIPERWMNQEQQVTMKRDTANNEIVFFIYNGDIQNESETLLKVKIFERSKLVDDQLPYGYTMLASNGQILYGYNLRKTHTDFDLTEEEVWDLFHVLK